MVFKSITNWQSLCCTATFRDFSYNRFTGLFPDLLTRCINLQHDKKYRSSLALFPAIKSNASEQWQGFLSLRVLQAARRQKSSQQQGSECAADAIVHIACEAPGCCSNIAGNTFGGALPDSGSGGQKPFTTFTKLRKLDISHNKFQGIFTCIPDYNDPYNLTCQNWQPGLPGYEIASIQNSCAYAYCNPGTLKCTRASLGDGSRCPSVPGVDSSCATFGCRNGSCAVTSNYSANSSCLLITEYQNYQCWLDGVCNGAGHCLYDYGAKDNISCDYIPGNDFCSVQKCRNGTCAQISPLPDGTSCAHALDVINSVPGPFADYKGCATASCMHGKCMLKFLSNGTPCNITGINTGLYPDCVNGKCSEGKCQTDSYKPVDTPCGGPCPHGCCAFCNENGMCHFDTGGPCNINGYDGQCSGTTCILDP
eukprot:SM000020S06105  [mRNA]  locus=s20:1047792:1050955:- [translate_table: standard]